MIVIEETSARMDCEASTQSHAAPEPAVYEAALLVSLFGPDPCIPDSATNWQALENMASENGVLALACNALLGAGVDVPSSFAQSAKASRASATRHATELHILLREFAHRKIDILPLKGPALSLAFYGDASLRSSNDLDLLVRRDDFPRAESYLIDHGFVPHGPRGDYERMFLRNDLIVELHFDLSDRQYQPLDTEDIWRRAEAAVFCGAPCYAMSQQDLALYLCCHGARHGFSRLIWTLDVAQSLQGWCDSEYKSLLDLAEQRDLSPWLILACEVLRAMLPERLPTALDALIASSPNRKRAKTATIRMFSEDWQLVTNDYRRLYLQIEPGPWKRLRYRMSYLLPTDRDHQWARRHHIPPGLMIVLRPFRLLGKHGLHRVLHTVFPRPI